MSLKINKIDWTSMKDVVSIKKITWQYEENENFYYIYAIDGVVVYTFKLKKTSPPSADQLDFENNFKNLAGGAVSSSVVAFDITFPEEEYTTTNTLQNARPVEGDFNVKKFKTKGLFVENSGINNVTFNVLGDFGPTTNPIQILLSAELLPGEGLSITEESPFHTIRINARSTLAGLPTTIKTRGYALGV